MGKKDKPKAESKGETKEKPEQEQPKVVHKKEKDLRYIVRMINTDLDGSKSFVPALSAIKGIGQNFATSIAKILDIPEHVKLSTLTEQQIKQTEEIIKNPLAHGFPLYMFDRRKDWETGEDAHLVSGDLAAALRKDIDFMKKIKSYRGIRHFYGLKMRGQRTGSHGAKMLGRSGRTVGVMKKGLVAKPAEGEKGAAGKDAPKAVSAAKAATAKKEETKK